MSLSEQDPSSVRSLPSTGESPDVVNVILVLSLLSTFNIPDGLGFLEAYSAASK